MESQIAGFVVIVTLITAGVVVLLMAMVNRRKLLEMRHRERLAMIERGLVPPPELDPIEFERRVLGMRPPSRSSVRFRAAGVLLIGTGLALMLLISFAAESPGVGIGVGGAVALVGATFVLNGLFSARDEVLPGDGAATQAVSHEPREPTTTGADRG